MSALPEGRMIVFVVTMIVGVTFGVPCFLVCLKNRFSVRRVIGSLGEVKAPKALPPKRGGFWSYEPLWGDGADPW